MAAHSHSLLDFPSASPAAGLVAHIGTESVASRHPGSRSLSLLQGPSAAAVRVREQIARIGPHFRCVLLGGPKGCGAEAAAHMLQAYSPLAESRFQTLDAETAERWLAPADRAALPARLRGLLFLPELNKLSAAAQRVLVRGLQLRSPHQLRLVGYAQEDARALAVAGVLHADLAGLLGGVHLVLPDLREREDDLPLLAEGIVSRQVARRGGAPLLLDSSFFAVLTACEWPGNLPQLQRTLREAVNSAQSTVLTGDDLRAAYHATARQAAAPSRPASVSVRLEDVLQRHIRKVLLASGGNKLRAAEALGISRSTLYRMLDAHAPAVDSGMRLAG